MDYIITNHVRERFVERKKESRNKYAHLRNCGSGCPHCVHLVYEMRRELTRYRRKLDEDILYKIRNSEEISYFKNNHTFMDYLVNRYGDDANHRFFHHEDIVFVTIRCPKRGNVITTCFDAKDSVFRDFLLRPKFSKKKKKEEFPKA